MMRQEVVARCGWMGDQEFLDLMAGVEAYEPGKRGLISLRYASDFYPRDTTEQLLRQFRKVDSANFRFTEF
jgi:hypothetical protein